MSRKNFGWLLFIGIAWGIVGQGLVWAQYQGLWVKRWNNPVSSFIGTSICWKTMAQSFKSSKSIAQNPRRVAFVSSGDYVMPSRLAHGFTQDEAQQKELEAAFIQFLKVFDQEIVSESDRNNVASAAAFFIANNFFVATKTDVSDQHLEALRNALGENLASHEKFQRMSSKKRQELYETLIIFSLLARYGCVEGEEMANKKVERRYRDFARESLKAMLGVSPEQMHFSSSGLSFRD